MPPSLCGLISPSPDEEDAVLLSLLAALFVVAGVLAGELDAFVLLLFVEVELVVVSDFEHPTKSAAAMPSAKISFNVFTKFLLSEFSCFSVKQQAPIELWGHVALQNYNPLCVRLY